jgi:hypothetical protein
MITEERNEHHRQVLQEVLAELVVVKAKLEGLRAAGTYHASILGIEFLEENDNREQMKRSHG